jgi:predicted RNA-binding Zn-ribbon protein involved in translation (DUF1610 family)/uncharacterized protein YprB with RNaseH-like and TPR domain
VKEKPENHKARVLFYDIETTPNLAYVWGKYEQDVIAYKAEWSILCFAWKWLGDQQVNLATTENATEKSILKVLWALLDEADIVVAHNGNRFDNKKANARFVSMGMKPPSPYKSVDTRELAKQKFAFNSNSLGDLGKTLGVGDKLKHNHGFDLWLGCMSGDAKSWKLMGDYNKRDVELLERVYLKLRPWSTNHPSISQLEGKEYACPNCGSEKLVRRGFRRTPVNTYQRLRCSSCGAYSRVVAKERGTRQLVVPGG